VIPPNANIEAIDTHLRLSELEKHRAQRAPIDHFFRTLASTHDGHSVGVILSGTGSDGTLGIRDIKAKGGLIIVQNPSDAEYDGMPQSAIATGLADFVLPVTEIAHAGTSSFAVSRSSLGRETQQAVGHAGQRRDDDDRAAGVAALALRLCLALGSDDRHQPLDGGAIRHRGSAELHHDHTQPLRSRRWSRHPLGRLAICATVHRSIP